MIEMIFPGSSLCWPLLDDTDLVFEHEHLVKLSQPWNAVCESSCQLSNKAFNGGFHGAQPDASHRHYKLNRE